MAAMSNFPLDIRLLPKHASYCPDDNPVFCFSLGRRFDTTV